MKKTRNANRISIKKDSGFRFSDKWQAMEAAQMMQMFIASQGYMVISTFRLEFKIVEITVHVSERPFPLIKNGYKYSTKEISSHMYYSEYRNVAERVRTITFTYEY